MQKHDAKILYSVDEATHLCGLGRTRIYEEINSGRLKAVKSGKRTFIPASAIQDWVDQLPLIDGGHFNAD